MALEPVDGNEFGGKLLELLWEGKMVWGSAECTCVGS